MAESSSGYQHITLRRSEGVAHIQLNRPDRLNALGIGPGSNRDELLDAAHTADADDDIGCILLTGAGRAFCAGGDLTSASDTETAWDEYRFLDRLGRFYEDLGRVSTPIVGGAHGLCLGAGLGLLAQCDLVVAADDARFGLVEGRIGHPGATELVPVIGPAWAKFLILTGELIDATTAERIGLVLAVTPTADMLERAFDLARRIAAVPRRSAVLNKAAVEAMRDAMGRSAARAVGRAHDVTTKTAAHQATAPDGRRFEDIVREDGIVGLKNARDQQFTGEWLKGAGA